MRCRLWFAALLLLCWAPPARGAALLAQGDGTPAIGYGVAVVATILVLLVVCWPARRE